MTTTTTLKVGDRLPALRLPTLDDAPVALESFLGKKFILFMWASW